MIDLINNKILKTFLLPKQFLDANLDKSRPIYRKLLVALIIRKVKS